MWKKRREKIKLHDELLNFSRVSFAFHENKIIISLMLTHFSGYDGNESERESRNHIKKLEFLRNYTSTQTYQKIQKKLPNLFLPHHRNFS